MTPQTQPGRTQATAFRVSTKGDGQILNAAGNPINGFEREHLAKAANQFEALKACANQLEAIRDYANMCKGTDIERVLYLANQVLPALELVRKSA